MIFRYSLLGGFWLFFCSCGVYTFTGASIHPDTKTLSIAQFANNALLGPSDMGNLISEKLREYFERNTSLTFVPEGGDIQLNGHVESYTISPTAPTGATQLKLGYASLTRLRIVTAVSYTNLYDTTFEFQDKKFSFFLDFNQNDQDITTNEYRFVEEILDQITIDIFNQSLANW